MSEVTVYIKRKKSQGRGLGAGKNSRSEPRYADEGKRRAVVNGIRFWDCGQYWTSSAWADIPYSFQARNNSDPTFPQFDNMSVAAGWPALRDYILGTSTSNFETHFRELDYESAEKYGLDVVANYFDLSPPNRVEYPVARDGSRLMKRASDWALVPVTGNGAIWTSKGLVIPDAVRTSGGTYFSSQGAFLYWGTRTDLFKITNGATYGSPVVSFTLAKNAHVFMMPRVQSGRFVTKGFFGTNDILFSPYIALPRSFWLTHNYTNGYGVLTRPSVVPSTPPSGTPSYPPQYQLADVPALVDTFRPNGFGWDNSSASYAASGFSLYPTSPAIFSIIGISGTMSGFGAGNTHTEVTEGTLMAVIKQAGQVFYVWSKTTQTEENFKFDNITGLL